MLKKGKQLCQSTTRCLSKTQHWAIWNRFHIAFCMLYIRCGTSLKWNKNELEYSYVHVCYCKLFYMCRVLKRKCFLEIPSYTLCFISQCHKWNLLMYILQILYINVNKLYEYNSRQFQCWFSFTYVYHSAFSCKYHTKFAHPLVRNATYVRLAVKFPVTNSIINSNTGIKAWYWLKYRGHITVAVKTLK